LFRQLSAALAAEGICWLLFGATIWAIHMILLFSILLVSELVNKQLMMLLEEIHLACTSMSLAFEG
jgi:hypothetical protein